MTYFWWNFDRGGALGKTFGVLLLCLVPIGCFLYYLVFYRRSVATQRACVASAP